MRSSLFFAVCIGWVCVAHLQAQDVPFVELKGHTGAVNSVAFSQDGKKIVTVGRDGTVRMWDVEAGEELQKLTEISTAFHFVTFSPDGKRIITVATRDNPREAYGISNIRIWDVEVGSANFGKELRKLEGSRGYHYAAFSPDGKKVIVPGGISTSSSIIWDAESGEILQRLNVNRESVRIVAFSPDGKKIVTGSFERIARIWDAETGEKLQELGEHANNLSSAVFSFDGKTVVTANGGIDSAARIWDAVTGKELHKFEMKNWDRGIHTAVLSPDGKRILAIGGHTGSDLCVWDVESGKELQQFGGRQFPNNTIFVAVFSLDGKKIFAAGDYAVCIWDIESGEELKRWTPVIGFRLN